MADPPESGEPAIVPNDRWAQVAGLLARWGLTAAVRQDSHANCRPRRTEVGSVDAQSCYRTGHGFTSQISLAYSVIARSLENFPAPAIFNSTFRVQASGLAYASQSRWSAST